MTKKMMTLGILTVLLVFALSPVVALAQDGTDWEATAEALDNQANAAKWRANAVRATATAEHQAALATASAESQAATKTAEVMSQRATATAHAASMQATATAGAIQAEATRTAGDVLATRQAADWATQATATGQAIRAEATITAINIERASRARDVSKATGALVTYVSWAGLIFAVILAVGFGNRLVSWALSQRRQPPRPPGRGAWGDVKEGDYTDPGAGDPGRVQIYMLPEPAQIGLSVGPDGRIWRE